LIKTSIFAAVVLVLANTFKIGKRTVSDQVRLELSHAENAAEMTGIPKTANTFSHDVKAWAHQVTADQKDGMLRRAKMEKSTVAHVLALRKRHAVKVVSEEIPASERQKLRALMRELNSSHASD